MSQNPDLFENVDLWVDDLTMTFKEGKAGFVRQSVAVFKEHPAEQHSGFHC